MSPVTRNRALGLVVAFVVLAVDQWVKAMVRGSWGVYDSYLRSMVSGTVDEGISVGLPFFRLLYTENRGVSLGMLTATSPEMRWILVAATSAIALFVFVWMLRETRRIDILALALVLGGALGNIYDRFRFGYVIDYADLHFGDFRPFFIFNVADAAITVGVLIILARSLLSSEKPDPANDTEIAPES